MTLPVMRQRNDLRRLPVMRAVNDSAHGAPLVPPPDSAPDGRLSGDAGAELGAREVLPVMRPAPSAPEPQAQTSPLTEYPGYPPSPEPGPDELRRHYAQLLQTPVTDTNGRGRSALRMLGAPVEPSNSLGYLIGQRLGHAVSGLLNPKEDEETIDRPQELARAQAAAAGEAALEKTAQERADAESERKLRESQRKKLDVEAQELPKMNEARRTDSDRRLDAVERRLDITESYNKGRLDNEGRRIDEAGRHNKAGEEDRDLDRESRERIASENRASAQRIAQWRIAAQKEIAASAQSVQRDRMRLSADQFQKRYPGAGFTLTPEDIAAKAKAANMLPEDAAKLAVKQGYTIK